MTPTTYRELAPEARRLAGFFCRQLGIVRLAEEVAVLALEKFSRSYSAARANASLSVEQGRSWYLMYMVKYAAIDIARRDSLDKRRKGEATSTRDLVPCWRPPDPEAVLLAKEMSQIIRAAAGEEMRLLLLGYGEGGLAAAELGVTEMTISRRRNRARDRAKRAVRQISYANKRDHERMCSEGGAP